jgi:hypothetical protein
MRKCLSQFQALILILSLSANGSAVTSNDPTFGDDFIRWVEVNARKFSQDLTRADYRSRVLNDYQIHYQEVGSETEVIHSELENIYRQTKAIESEIESHIVSSTNDSYKTAIRRQDHSQQMLNELVAILRRIEGVKLRQQGFDRLSEKNRFLDRGLHHVGKESLLESIVDLSNSLSKTLTADYTVSVHYTSDGESSRGSGSASGSDTLMYSSLAASLAWNYFGPEVGAIAMIVVMALASNEIARYQQKVEKQVERLNKGLALFEKKTISTDEMYAIYASEHDNNKKEFEKIRKELDSSVNVVTESWTNLYKFNVYRLEAARTFLTRAKVSQIELEYSLRSPITKIFEARLLNSLGRDLDNQLSEINKLENEFNKETDQFRKLELKEEYEDSLHEATAWYQELKTRRSFIPLYPRINFLESVITEKLRSVDTVSGNTDKNYKTVPRPKLAKANIALVNRIDSVIKQEYEKKTSTMLKGNIKSQADFYSVDAKIQRKPIFPIVSYQAGTYTISLTHDSSLRDRFNPNSTFDGGYSYDVRRPSGINQLNSAADNINERIINLNYDFQNLSRAVSEWNLDSSRYAQNLNTNISEAKALQQSSFEAFERAHKPSLQAVRARLQSSLPSQINQTSLENFMRAAAISSSITRNIHPSRVRIESTPILGLNLSDSFYRSSNTTHQNQIIRESQKLDVSLKNTEARVNRNIASNTPDQVFSSKEDFEELKTLLNNSVRYARHFSDGKNEIVQNKPITSYEVSNGYLRQVKMMRLYSEGLISERTFEDLSIVDRTFLENEYQKLLHEFDSTCNVGTADEQNNSTPCNRFTSMVLKSIYGVSDFENFPQGDSRSIAFANQISNFVSTDKNWHFIGNADNQEAINAASLYAAEGRPVIAVRSNPGGTGHVCMIMPGIPRLTSTNKPWEGLLVPFASNWSLNNPSLRFYNGRLSGAFSSPEGVKFYYRELR